MQLGVAGYINNAFDGNSESNKENNTVSENFEVTVQVNLARNII